MAPKSQPSRSRPSQPRGLLKFTLGFLCAFVVLGLGVFLYFRFGDPPVATADKPFPFEAQIVQVPMSARIARQLETPPFGTGEDAFEAGAHLYVRECSSCHGAPGHEVAFAKYMYPVAPQLWKKHARGNVVGVSDDDAGETYWKIKNGLRLTGMPAYQHVLSTDQMWDIALLLKNADQPLPDPVLAILQSK